MNELLLKAFFDFVTDSYDWLNNDTQEHSRLQYILGAHDIIQILLEDNEN